MLPLKNAGNIDVQLKLKVILTFTFLIRSGVWVSLCDILGSDCGTYSGDSLIFGSWFSCFLYFHLYFFFNLSLTPLVRSLTNFVSSCSFFNFSLQGHLIFFLHFLHFHTVPSSVSSFVALLPPSIQPTISLLCVPTFSPLFSHTICLIAPLLFLF